MNSTAYAEMSVFEQNVVTMSNEEDGFAHAGKHFVLRAHDRATLKSAQRS